ncbi:hypothetical protein F2Q68_00030087 [Brassica cretica]|uniref:Uncharacterized protein n=1 Tax=Brassica cretica TaxID=69181 RepID=A0A8S9GAE1_BRACR|nr:hypothetical protein F2Q68_00030087 [Brassica cretica]
MTITRLEWEMGKYLEETQNSRDRIHLCVSTSTSAYRVTVLDVIVSIVVESILQMKELQSLNQTQRIALAGVLALLFPIFSPNLFRPLGRASPSLFSEWNAPRPRHLRLLEGALHRQISIRQQVELWSPLPDQAWKPCTQSFTGSPLPEKSQGFLQVFLDGGLNQQRMGGVGSTSGSAAELLAATVLDHAKLQFDTQRIVDQKKKRKTPKGSKRLKTPEIEYTCVCLPPPPLTELQVSTPLSSYPDIWIALP